MKIRKKLLVMIIVILLPVYASIMPDTVSASGEKNVAVSEKSAVLIMGKTLKLELENAPKNKKNSWQSSDEKIASVSDEGKVTPKKCGKATITAGLGKKKYICRVTVIEKNASDVKALKQLIKE